MGKKGSRSSGGSGSSRSSQPKQASQRRVVDAKSNNEGDITHVKIEGNQGWTPLERATKMADQGKLENVHSVTKPDGDKYLRSNPDSKTTNNLDEMAKD
jgi:hypothetical protein